MGGREIMRPTGSPLQGVNLGGRRRSDGEDQQDEVSNPLAYSAAASPSAVEMAEIGQNTDLQTSTGVFKKGESVEIVFKSSVFWWLNREELDGVLENRDEIPVGDPDADINELRATFGAEEVARSLRVWIMLIHITSQSIQQETLTCRSPQ